jgi:hypothetical protein
MSHLSGEYQSTYQVVLDKESNVLSVSAKAKGPFFGYIHKAKTTSYEQNRRTDSERLLYYGWDSNEVFCSFVIPCRAEATLAE